VIINNCICTFCWCIESLIYEKTQGVKGFKITGLLMFLCIMYVRMYSIYVCMYVSMYVCLYTYVKVKTSL
jgi:hypothetical protein